MVQNVSFVYTRITVEEPYNYYDKLCVKYIGRPILIRNFAMMKDWFKSLCNCVYNIYSQFKKMNEYV